MKRIITSLAAVILLGSAGAAAQEQVAAARELYASAAYEDALDVLGKMQTSGAEVASSEADVLRAFCLIALRRDDEARSVIEAVITERPTYVPGEEDASPRVRSEFRQIRRRLLPSVARQLYLSAREDYEQKRGAAAAAKFTDLLKVLNDVDLAEDQTVADLRLLAEGFRVVSEAAVKVATSADTQPLGTAAPPVAAPTNGGDSAPAAKPVSTLGRAANAVPAVVTVTPPVVINQKLPPWRDVGSFARGEFSGAIDFVIDEQGRVETVSLRKSVHPLYDQALLEAAKTWTYQPAKRGDQPIKFQKTLVVRLNSR